MFNGIRGLLRGTGQREFQATRPSSDRRDAGLPPARRISRLDEIAAYLRECRIQETTFGVRIILIDEDSCLRGDVFYARDAFSFTNLGSKVAKFAGAIGATAFFVVVDHQQEQASFTSSDFLLAEQIYKGASWFDVLMIDYLVVGGNGVNSRLFGIKQSPFVQIDQSSSC